MMGNEAFQVKRPVYPLLAVAASLVILLCGLLASLRLPVLAAYLAALAALYLLFGYGRVLGRCLLLLVIGVLSALVTLLRRKYGEAAVTVGRLLVLGMSSVTLISTPPIALTRSLTELRVPRAVTLGMLVTVRFIPILRGEVRRVRDAMKTRGVNSAWVHPGTVYRAFLVPFMTQLINMSDLLSISVETRGFDLLEKDATVYKTVRFTARDALFAACLAGLSAAAVIGRTLL